MQVLRPPPLAPSFGNRLTQDPVQNWCNATGNSPAVSLRSPLEQVKLSRRLRVHEQDVSCENTEALTNTKRQLDFFRPPYPRPLLELDLSPPDLTTSGYDGKGGKQRLHACYFVLLIERKTSLLLWFSPSSTEKSSFIYSKMQTCCFHMLKAMKSACYELSVMCSILTSSGLLSGVFLGFFNQNWHASGQEIGNQTFSLWDNQ